MGTHWKKHLRGAVLLLALLLLALLLLALPVGAQDDDGDLTGELVVFAAASLTDAFEAIGAAFEEANPGVVVLFSFGGSSTLAAQLNQGAPADVFASANIPQMDAVVEGERVAEDAPQIFAQNRLVVIAPADNPAGIESLCDLQNEGLQMIVAAPEVPVREYTDTMLEAMGADPGYGEAYRDAVIANIVSEEPNVRQVAAKIALGEADAGVVYLSDVTPDIAEDVITLTVPDAFNVIAEYPIAAIADSESPELAAAFVDFVLSETGQTILAEWNLVPAVTFTDDAPEPAETPEVGAATVTPAPTPTVEAGCN